MLVSNTDREGSLGGGEWGDVGGRQSGNSQPGLGQVQIPPPSHSTSLTTTSSPSGGVLTVSLQRFGSVPTPGRALRDTRNDRINGIDCEHVDLQRRELGASARLRKKKLSGINKQTDRLGEHRKSPLLPPSVLLISLLHITHSSI